MTWPIGIGKSFKGVYHLYEKQLNLFDNQNKFVKAENYITINDIFSNEIVQYIGEDFSKKLREDVEVIQGVYDKFEREEYLNGEISPVFFGSAVNNFGIKELLDTFVEIAPSPKGRESDKEFINAEHSKLTGFIFKIHANLDPKHRDRIAFLRIVSGKFERNKNYYHVRQKKWMKFSNPTAFMAQQKSVIDEAYPGDVIGLYDSGNFKIGDTLTEGEELHFKGIPAFSPEIFKYVVNKDPMKTKQLQKGLEQLTEEGVVQLFYKKMDNRKIVGTVGQLQFEVLQYRLAHEYSAKCDFDTIPIYKAVWLHSNDEKKLQEFVNERSSYIAYDKQDRPVFLAESAWLLQMAQEKYPEIKFYTISEFENS
jgi:peptide chain release factor 3